jgi:glycosyltransferase involved in cell wall biosynthesis
MTILGIFLINQIRTGGDRRYLELMELLAARGNKVLVIMNTYLEYTPKHLIQIKIPVKYIRHHFPPASYLFKKSVKRNFNEIMDVAVDLNSIDFIHIHGDIYLKTAISIKKQINKPFFYASRNNDIDRDRIIRSKGGLSIGKYIFSVFYEQINKYREKQIARFAEIITFQCLNERDAFCSRTKVSKLKTIIIPGNIGLPRCTINWENKNKSVSIRNIIFTGGLSSAKGVLILPPVLSLLKKKGFGFLHCSILGRGDPTKLNKIIKKYDVSDMITLEDYVDPFPYLIKNDLFLYPVLYDAYPDAVLEALHTGCPVFTSAVGGLPDMLQYPELLFEPGNIDQIACKIEQCITDTAFYNRIRMLCAERANIHRFDWAERFEQAMADYPATPRK